MDPVTLARVLRSGLEESTHEGDVVVVDPEGRVVASAGDPGRGLYARSCMKPLQAAVSLSLCTYDFTDLEIAVMAASHNAEPVHVEAVRSLLTRAGVPGEALQCPPRRPMDEEAAAAAGTPLPIHSDCSGKHGGMLAACRAQGWPMDTYLDPDHPYQQAVLQAVLRATGLDSVRVGVDGCGAPVHGMPISAMATIYARLADPNRLGDLGPFAGRVVDAMVREPYLVAGRHRVDTAVMKVAPAVAVKAGAEGLLCAADRDRRWGLAVKVADGGSRAAGPALIRALARLGVLVASQVESLRAFARPDVLGGGRPVGELISDFDLPR
jgi:L-asparaginase II